MYMHHTHIHIPHKHTHIHKQSTHTHTYHIHTTHAPTVQHIPPSPHSITDRVSHFLQTVSCQPTCKRSIQPTGVCVCVCVCVCVEREGEGERERERERVRERERGGGGRDKVSTNFWQKIKLTCHALWQTVKTYHAALRLCTCTIMQWHQRPCTTIYLHATSAPRHYLATASSSRCYHGNTADSTYIVHQFDWKASLESYIHSLAAFCTTNSIIICKRNTEAGKSPYQRLVTLHLQEHCCSRWGGSLPLCLDYTDQSTDSMTIPYMWILSTCTYCRWNKTFHVQLEHSKNLSCQRFN